VKPLVVTLLTLALVAAGCGGDDDGAESAPATDEVAVRITVKKWLLEGSCEAMTDRFLEDQLLSQGETRAERCELFEKQHTKPQYSEDDIKITDVSVTGTKATLVVGQEGVDISSKYSLVKTGGDWRIDAAELQ
jgi:hypothetical protein